MDELSEWIQSKVARIKISIVEDSRRLRLSFGTALRKLGSAVDQAEDGSSGLAFALSNDYDVVVRT